MAPNRFRLTQVPVELKNLVVAPPKLNDYQAPRSEAASPSYWDWPADAPEEKDEVVDIFSVDHITAYLINDAKQRRETTKNSSTNALSDDYWAETSTSSSSPVESVSVPQHDAVNSDEYWNERPASSDNYWNEAKASPCVHHEVNLSSKDATNYWDKESHQAQLSDAYWAEPQEDQQRIASEKYWNWSVDRQNASDRYWNNNCNDTITAAY